MGIKFVYGGRLENCFGEGEKVGRLGENLDWEKNSMGWGGADAVTVWPKKPKSSEKGHFKITILKICDFF